MRIKAHKVVFMFLLVGMISSVKSSWIYRPISTAIEKTDLAMTARIIDYRQIDNQKYAYAQPLAILYGDWLIDSMIQLPIRERPDTGMISSAFYEILYDSNATYLLLLKKKNGYIVLADYPWLTKFKLDSTNMALIDDIKELIRIEAMTDTVEKTLAYRELLTSHYVDVRESVAWELHNLECEEALHGLLIAMKDTAENVVVNALAGFYLLGRKGINSPDVVASLESLIIYQKYSSLLYRAYAAQNGYKAIPLLHAHYEILDDPREGVLNALTILRDTTALDCFREAVFYPERGQSLKRYALELLLLPDSLTIPFPDSVILSWAMFALSDTNRGIQEAAIKLLEKKTDMNFGDVGALRGDQSERAEKRQKIVKKWQKWYSEGLRKR